MNNLSKLLLEAADLLTEGAVKTNRNPDKKLTKYLKRHGYEGDNKSGTITVNGKKIQVDRDIKSRTAKTSDGEYIPRQTAMDATAKDKIIIGKEFVNIKNNKRRDALLNHELGHNKYHNPNNNNITKESKDALLDGLSKDTSIQAFNTSAYKDDVRKELEDIHSGSKTKDPDKYDEKDKIRHKNLEKLKKHENDGIHANRIEFEADIYASQQKNGNQMKRAIRDGYKYATSKKGISDQIKGVEKAMDMSLDVDENTKKDMRKKTNIMAQNDMKQRSKAMKDKSVNRQVYRESIELILTEAIDLLDME